MYFATRETEGVFPLTSALSVSLETKVVYSTLPSGLDMKLAFPLQAIATSVSFPIVIKRNTGYGCVYVCVCVFVYIHRNTSIYTHMHMYVCMYLGS